MREKVIIIGAGPGGLAAAILLASAGLDVKVVERLNTVGGRTSRIEAEGYRFDLGPTFFLYPKVINEIFNAAGTSLEAEVEMTRLDPQYRIQFGTGGKIDATADFGRMEQQIADICPNDAPGFRKFILENREKLRRMEPWLQKPFHGWKDVLSLRMLRELPMLRPHQSLDQYLSRFFKDPRIRLAFSFQSKYLGMSPFRCPSLFSILSFLEYEYGVFHPTGGCSAVTVAMARVAQRLGVTIQTGCPVEEVVFDGRRAVGIRTAEGEEKAAAVVMNADFGRGISKLVPNGLRRRWSDRTIERKKYSCSTFMMYLGVEGEFKLPHHTIHISAEYARNLDDIERRHVLSDDPSFYVQNAATTDCTLAPKGHSTLYVLVPVPHVSANINWDRQRDSFRALVLRQLAKAGYEDISGRIRYEKIITPQHWDVSYEVYRGATFNLTHSLDQMLHLRPHNRFEDTDRLYLVGGGTHPGSGLPVIFESARISSRLLLEDLGIAPTRVMKGTAEKPAAALPVEEMI